MSHRRLIVHCMIPGGADDALAERFFAPALPPAVRLRLTDPMHERRRRWPEALGLPPRGLRLAGGRVPIGYFDAVQVSTVHVCVLGDPEAGFVRFVECVRALPPEAALRFTGLGPAALAGEDIDGLVTLLLAQPRVRRRQIGVMTRLCAGLSRVAPEGPGPEPLALLRAARANLARCNVLSGLDVTLDQFADEVAAMFGWAPPALSSAAGLTTAAVDGLRPAVRDALRAALDLDLRLYAGAWESLDLMAG